MNPNPAKDGSFTRSDDGVFPSLYDMLSGGHLPTPDSDDGQSYLHPKLRYTAFSVRHVLYSPCEEYIKIYKVCLHTAQLTQVHQRSDRICI